MMKIVVSIFLLAILLLCWSDESFGQIEKTRTTHKFRLSFYAGSSLQTFYDRYSKIQWNRTTSFIRDGWSQPSGFNLAKEVAFGYHINEVNSIFISANVNAANYLEECALCGEAGDVIYREWYLFGLYYEKRIFALGSISLNTLSGITHRRGGEVEITSYGWFDILTLGQEMSDFGGLVGLSINQYLFKKRVAIRFTIKHNEYLYRKSTGRGSRYSWDNGSSRRMTSAALNLGLRFWKVKNKKP